MFVPGWFPLPTSKGRVEKNLQVLSPWKYDTSTSLAKKLAIALLYGLVGWPHQTSRRGDDLEGVDVDGSRHGVHAELVTKQADVAAKLKAAWTFVGETFSHAALRICDKKISWRSAIDIEIGKLEHGLVGFRTITEAQTCPPVSGGPTGGGLATVGVQLDWGVNCWGWWASGGVGAVAGTLSR